MSSKFKLTIFIAFVLFFLITAPLVILYSYGYRFDMEDKRITKTGGIYVKAKPTRVNIRIDGKEKKRTDLFFGSSFIKNIIPKEYNIKLIKENYFPWEKNLEIKEQVVTEINNVSLIPKNPKKEILSKEIDQLWFFPDPTKILIKEQNENDWELKLYDVNEKLKSHLIKEEDFSTTSENAKILNISFSSDSKKILLKIGAKEQIKYHLLTIDPFPPQEKFLSQLTNSQIGQKLIFNPSNSQEIIFQQNKKIYSYNIEEERINYYYSELSQKNGKEIVTFSPAHNPNEILYLTSSGFIYKGPEEKINSEPFEIKKETQYKLKETSDFVFLLEKESGRFYSIKKGEEPEKELLDENIKDFKLSPHQDKLIYISDYEIKMFYLRDQSFQPFSKKGDKFFISRFSNKVNSIEWSNNYYFIFKNENSIKIAETDIRDGINIITLLSFENDFELEWDSFNNNLLVFINKNLSSYKLPTF